MHILLVGCGSVGTHILLANSISVKYKFTICDFDKYTKENNFFSNKFKVDFLQEILMGTKTIKNTYKKRIQDIFSELEIFDMIILAVDNIATRMDVNLYAINNKIPLIDVGIDGYFFHIKKIGRSCLYCIKDLYKLELKHNICRENNTDNIISTSSYIAAQIANILFIYIETDFCFINGDLRNSISFFTIKKDKNCFLNH